MTDKEKIADLEERIAALESSLRERDERVKALERAVAMVREGLESDLTYRNDCLDHHTADCEVAGCEDPDECSRCLTNLRISWLPAARRQEEKS